MYARSRPGRTIGFDLPDPLTEVGGLEQVVAHYCPNTSACISEEILGFGRELPTDSEEREEPTPRTSGEVLWTRTRPAVAAAEQHCP